MKGSPRIPKDPTPEDPSRAKQFMHFARIFHRHLPVQFWKPAVERTCSLSMVAKCGKYLAYTYCIL